MPVLFWTTTAAGAYMGLRRKNLIAGLALGALAGFILEILLCNR